MVVHLKFKLSILGTFLERIPSDTFFALSAIQVEFTLTENRTYCRLYFRIN